MSKLKIKSSHYVDQSPKYESFSTKKHITFFASYTPHGIRNLESKYIYQMRWMPSRKFADNLKKEIKNNIHLHKTIKNNLLLNLKEARKHINKVSKAMYELKEARRPYMGRTVRILKGDNKNIIGEVVSFCDSVDGTNAWVGVKSKNPKYRSSSYGFPYTEYYDECDLKVIQKKEIKYE